MIIKANIWIILAGISGALSVALGAYGAHGLEDTSQYLRDSFNTGVDYQMWHSLALIAVAWLSKERPSYSTSLAGYAFCGGILLFSGTLYYFALTGNLLISGAAPIGGACFIAGWLLISYSGFKLSK